MTVVVEASTNLANPTWTPLATNTLTSGSAYFSDPAVDELSWPFLPPPLAIADVRRSLLVSGTRQIHAAN